MDGPVGRLEGRRRVRRARRARTAPVALPGVRAVVGARARVVHSPEARTAVLTPVLAACAVARTAPGSVVARAPQPAGPACPALAGRPGRGVPAGLGARRRSGTGVRVPVGHGVRAGGRPHAAWRACGARGGRSVPRWSVVVSTSAVVLPPALGRPVRVGSGLARRTATEARSTAGRATVGGGRVAAPDLRGPMARRAPGIAVVTLAGAIRRTGRTGSRGRPGLAVLVPVRPVRVPVRPVRGSEVGGPALEGAVPVPVSGVPASGMARGRGAPRRAFAAVPTRTWVDRLPEGPVARHDRGGTRRSTPAPAVALDRAGTTGRRGARAILAAAGARSAGRTIVGARRPVAREAGRDGKRPVAAASRGTRATAGPSGGDPVLPGPARRRHHVALVLVAPCRGAAAAGRSDPGRPTRERRGRATATVALREGLAPGAVGAGNGQRASVGAARRDRTASTGPVTGTRALTVGVAPTSAVDATIDLASADVVPIGLTSGVVVTIDLASAVVTTIVAAMPWGRTVVRDPGARRPALAASRPERRVDRGPTHAAAPGVTLGVTLGVTPGATGAVVTDAGRAARRRLAAPGTRGLRRGAATRRLGPAASPPGRSAYRVRTGPWTPRSRRTCCSTSSTGRCGAGSGR